MKHLKHLATGVAISTITAPTLAFAAARTASQSLLSSLPMLMAFGFLFYFLLICPQSQRTKKHQAMLTNLAKGDEVITNGGILGKIEDITDAFITLTIAKGINVNVQKNQVTKAMPKGTIKNS